MRVIYGYVKYDIFQYEFYENEMSYWNKSMDRWLCLWDSHYVGNIEIYLLS